ncbi:MAG: nuclear transport factor 2 family protein [Candidatus Zixiibacteriota bacterium]
MGRVLISIILVITILLWAGCGKSDDSRARLENNNISSEEGSKMSSTIAIEEEKAKIKQVVEGSIGWALTKDKDYLFSLMWQDSNLFFFNPDNAGNINGFEAFRQLTENVFMNDAFKAIRFEVKDLRIQISQGGDVAWWAGVLYDYGEWNGKPANWEGVRWTGVTEKRDGKWVIMQMHFSYPTEAMKK